MKRNNSEELARAKSEFFKRREIVIKNLPPVTYQEVKDFLNGYCVVDIAISKKCRQAIVTLKNGEEAEEIVAKFTKTRLFNTEVFLTLNPNTKLLCIDNVPPGVSHQEFYDFLCTFGKVDKYFLMGYKNLGSPAQSSHHKGYGFVEYVHNAQKIQDCRQLIDGLVVWKSVLGCRHVTDKLLTFDDLHSSILRIDNLSQDSQYLETVGNTLYNLARLKTCKLSDGREFALAEFKTCDDADLAYHWLTGNNVHQSQVQTSFCMPGFSLEELEEVFMQVRNVQHPPPQQSSDPMTMLQNVINQNGPMTGNSNMVQQNLMMLMTAYQHQQGNGSAGNGRFPLDPTSRNAQQARQALDVINHNNQANNQPRNGLGHDRTVPMLNLPQGTHPRNVPKHNMPLPGFSNMPDHGRAPRSNMNLRQVTNKAPSQMVPPAVNKPVMTRQPPGLVVPNHAHSQPVPHSVATMPAGVLRQNINTQETNANPLVAGILGAQVPHISNGNNTRNERPSLVVIPTEQSQNVGSAPLLPPISIGALLNIPLGNDQVAPAMIMPPSGDMLNTTPGNIPILAGPTIRASKKRTHDNQSVYTNLIDTSLQAEINASLGHVLPLQHLIGNVRRENNLDDQAKLMKGLAGSTHHDSENTDPSLLKPSITPIGRKRSHPTLLPAPEASPEGDYIGQHSQGIGAADDSKLSSRREPIGEEDMNRQSLGGMYRLDTPRSVQSFTTETESRSSRASLSDRPDTAIRQDDGWKVQKYLDEGSEYAVKYLPEPPPKTDRDSVMSTTTCSETASVHISDASVHDLSPQSAVSSVSRASLPSSRGHVYTSDWMREFQAGADPQEDLERMSRASSVSTLRGVPSQISTVSTTSGPSLKRARWEDIEQYDQSNALDKYLQASPLESEGLHATAERQSVGSNSIVNEHENGEDFEQESINFGETVRRDTGGFAGTSFANKRPVSSSTPYVVGIEDPIREAKLRSPHKPDEPDNRVTSFRQGPLKADHAIPVPEDSQKPLITLPGEGDVTKRISWGAESEASAMSADSIASAHDSRLMERSIPIKSPVKLPIDLSQLDKPLEEILKGQGIRDSRVSERSEKSVDSGRESSARLSSNQSFVSRTSGSIPASSYIVYPRDLRSATPNVSNAASEKSSGHDETSELMKQAGVDYISAEDRSRLLGGSYNEHASRGSSFSPQQVPNASADQSGPTGQQASSAAPQLKVNSRSAYISVNDRRKLIGLSPEQIEVRRTAMAFSPLSEADEPDHREQKLLSSIPAISEDQGRLTHLTPDQIEARRAAMAFSLVSDNGKPIHESQQNMGFLPSSIYADEHRSVSGLSSNQSQGSRASQPDSRDQPSRGSSLSVTSNRSGNRPVGDGEENRQGVSPAFSISDRGSVDGPSRAQLAPTRAVYPHRKSKVANGVRHEELYHDGDTRVDILKVDHASRASSRSSMTSDLSSRYTPRNDVDEVDSLLSSRSAQRALEHEACDDMQSERSQSQTSEVPSLAMADLMSQHGSSADSNGNANNNAETYHPTLPEPIRTVAIDQDTTVDSEFGDRPSTASSVASSAVISVRTVDTARTEDVSVSSDVEKILQKYERRNRGLPPDHMNAMRKRLSPTGSDVSHDSMARKVDQLLTRKSAGEDGFQGKRNSRSPKRLSKSSEFHSMSLTESISLPMGMSMSDESTGPTEVTKMHSSQEQQRSSQRSRNAERSSTSRQQSRVEEEHTDYPEESIASRMPEHVFLVPPLPKQQRRDSYSSVQSVDSMARRVHDLINPIGGPQAPPMTGSSRMKPSISMHSLQSEDSLSRRVEDLLNPIGGQRAPPMVNKLKPSMSIQSFQSEDSLTRRVEDLLADTSHLDINPMLNGRKEIDYSALRKDLDDIENSLNLHSFSRLGDRSSGLDDEQSLASATPQDGSRNSSSPTQTKRLTWDHGADLAYSDIQENFIGNLKDVGNVDQRHSADSAVSIGRSEPDGKSSAKMTLKGIQPILTSGIVPVDMAMDILDEQLNNDLDGLWTYRSEASTIQPDQETYRAEAEYRPESGVSSHHSDVESDRTETIVDQNYADYGGDVKMAPRVSALTKSDHYSSTDSLARKVKDILKKDSPKKQARDILNAADLAENNARTAKPDRSYIQYPPELASDNQTHSGEESVEEEYARLRRAGRPASVAEPRQPRTETAIEQEVREGSQDSLESRTVSGLSQPTLSSSQEEVTQPVGRSVPVGGTVDPRWAATPLHRDVRMPMVAHDRYVERDLAHYGRHVDSFSMTPMTTTGPLTATATAKSFMANQLERMAQRRFGALDLRTPFRRATDDLDIGRYGPEPLPSRVYHRDHRESLSRSGFHEAPDLLTADDMARGRSHSDPIERSVLHAGHLSPHHGTGLRHAGEGDRELADLHTRRAWADERELQASVPQQRENVYRNHLTHASHTCPHRSTVPPSDDVSVTHIGVELPLETVPQKDTHADVSAGQHGRHFPHVETRPTPTYVDSVGHFRNHVRDTSFVPSRLVHDSSQSPEEEEAEHSATSSEGSGRRSATDMPGLRPYKPRGGHDVYYVESSSVDESNISVAQSETTLESTHTGSDDAEGPMISSRHFGSRQDSSGKHTGIYGSRKSPKREPRLRTIEEGEDVRKEMEALEKTMEQALHTSIQRSAEITRAPVDMRAKRDSASTKDLSGIRRQFEEGENISPPPRPSVSFAEDLHGRPPKSFIEYPSSLQSREAYSPLVPDEEEHTSTKIPLSSTDQICDKVSESNKNENESSERGNWASGLEFLLSCIGYAIGLGNIWRFPYLCMKNGGGAFLIPYFFFLFTCGVPLFFLELALGQFSSFSPVGVWGICPLFKGLGYGMFFISFAFGTITNVVLAWILYYLVSSFTAELPWTHCMSYTVCVETAGNSTNLTTEMSYNQSASSDYSAIGMNGSANLTLDVALIKIMTPAEKFWQYTVLQLSSGIDNLGSLRWQLVLCLAGALIVIFLCLFKGVQSLGKVVYVTATVPYLFLTILLVRGATLDGAMDGILFFLKPDWQKLATLQVWSAAGMQIFYSLGPAWGGLITMSSFNKFHHNVYRDALLVPILNCLTSFYAGFVVFSVVGFMAHETNMTVPEVITQGPGLAFIAYPEALSKLPISPLWAVLFFLMLIAVGLDSQFGLLETVISGLVDEFPKYLQNKKVLTCGVFCIVQFLFCLPLVSQGGLYIFQVLDWYMAAVSVMTIALLECIIVAWIYGATRFRKEIAMMTGSMPSFAWEVLWRGVTPVLMLGVLTYNLHGYAAPTYGDYQYPDSVIALAWFLGLVALLPIPGYMIYILYKTEGTLLMRLKKQLKPSPNWGPSLERHRQDYDPLIGPLKPTHHYTADGATAEETETGLLGTNTGNNNV